LEAEEPEPLLRFALRGERAALHDLYENVMSGAVPFASAMGTKEPSLWEQFVAWWYVRYRIRAHFADTLSLSNRYVAVADVPLRRQTQAAATAQAMSVVADRGNLLLVFLLPVAKYQDAYLNSRAWLRCTATALACERFRLAAARWPASPDDLVPRFLAAVPIDPYTGEPLRLTRVDDGIAIESAGPEHVIGPPEGISFRLWDVSKRRQPPPAEPPP
jgi:hypothetical protein